MRHRRAQNETYKLAVAVADGLRDRYGIPTEVNKSRVTLSGGKTVMCRTSGVHEKAWRVRKKNEIGETVEVIYKYPCATVNMHCHNKKVHSDLWLVEIANPGQMFDLKRYALFSDQKSKSINIFLTEKARSKFNDKYKLFETFDEILEAVAANWEAEQLEEMVTARMETL